MSDVESEATMIVEEFASVDSLDHSEVVADLETFLEYNVSLEEARRSVRSRYLSDYGVDEAALNTIAGPDAAADVAVADEISDVTSVANVVEDAAWYDVHVDVVELWDPNHPEMVQAGLIGDGDEVLKFTVWEDNKGRSPVPLLEEGESYVVRKAVCDVYDGRPSLQLTAETELKRADEPANAGAGGDSVTISGTLVDIRNGSGLIARCEADDCSRVLSDGRCSEHSNKGHQDGVPDLRIKGVIDDGTKAHYVTFSEDAVEEMSGMDLEDAQALARQELSAAAVTRDLEAALVGTAWTITGPAFDDSVLADSVVDNAGLDAEDFEANRDRVSDLLAALPDSEPDPNPDAVSTQAASADTESSV